MPAPTPLPDRPVSPAPDTAPPPRPVAVTPALLLPQILRPVRDHLQTTPAGDHRLEVRLSPQELGPLRLDIREGPEGTRITVMAERPETLDLVRRHAGELLAEFRLAGLPNTALDFAGWAGSGAAAHRGGPGPEAGPGQGRRRQTDPTAQAEQDPPETSPRQAALRQGVNLRV